MTTPDDGDRTGRSHGDTEPQVTGDEAASAPVHRSTAIVAVLTAASGLLAAVWRYETHPSTGRWAAGRAPVQPGRASGRGHATPRSKDPDGGRDPDRGPGSNASLHSERGVPVLHQPRGREVTGSTSASANPSQRSACSVRIHAAAAVHASRLRIAVVRVAAAIDVVDDHHRQFGLPQSDLRLYSNEASP